MVHAVHRLLALRSVTQAPSPAPAIEIRSPAPVASPQGAAASISDSSAHVKVEASLEPASAAPGDTVTVTATLRIDEGWHVNANPASADFLIATVVDVRSITPPGATDASKVEVVEVTYPKPTTLKAAGLGAEAINVYGVTAQVTARVRLPKEAASGTTIPLRVLAKFQACSDAGVCLMPAEWSGEVRVSVKP